MGPTDFAFAHLADAHVGAWPRDPKIRSALRASLLEALRLVSENDCEFLLISGDLFHTPVPDPAEAAPVAAALRRLASEGRRIYVIYGSHDYVAHRTSWLDVLAETGLFVKTAPEAVRAEGERWTLPFHVDRPTGAVIAGIPGRATGLDRSSFLAVDTEEFRATPGFKIFQFHAAVEEFLPEALRAHIRGVSVDDLPGGCDYYAGGHIHSPYEGPGPEGQGLLVNPGAIFGTSVTDLEARSRGGALAGLVLVRVRDGRPTVERRPTAPPSIDVFDVDVAGATAQSARAIVDAAVSAHERSGALLFPKVKGLLADGSPGSLGLRRSSGGEAAGAAAAIHWDLTELATTAPDGAPSAESPDALEAEALRALATELPEALVRHGRSETALAELLRELGTEIAEGEARADYEEQRLAAARRILGLPE